MSDGRRRLTLADFDDAGGPAIVQQAIAANKDERKRLQLTDFEDAQKPEEPFEGGTNLQVAAYTKDKGFHNLDTGVHINKKPAQFLAGAGKFFSDTGNRARQVTGRPGAQADIDEAARLDKPLMETTPAMLGNMAPLAVTGVPIANTARAAAIFGAGAGAATPTTSDEGLGAEFANPVLSGLAAAGGQKLIGGVADFAGKAANIAPTAGFNTLPRAVQQYVQRHGIPKPRMPYADAEVGANSELLNRLGIDHSIGDIDPKSMWRAFEDTAEPLKLGRRPFMQGQQEDLKGMLETTRAGINKPVIDPVTKQPVPDSFAMGQGLKDKFTQNKAAASVKWDDVDTLAAQPGVQPVKPTAMYAQAKALVDEKPDYFVELQDNALWRKMMGVERDTGPQTSVILQSNGVPFKKPQQLDFSEVRALRTALGREYKDADKPSRQNAYRLMLKALDDDLDAWGANSGNSALNDAYGVARQFYRENVVPYRDPLANPSKSPIFSNIAAKDKVDADMIPAGVFKANRQQLAQDFMDLSTPSGQQAGKNELINEIVGAGLNPQTETGLSGAMINHSNRYSAPGAAVFNPTEQAGLNDAVNGLKLTRRAANLGFSPPKTGFQAVPWAAGTALMGGASVPLYYGLNATLGDQLSPSERVASAFVLAPLAAYAAARGGMGMTHGKAGKMLHLVDPKIANPVLGGIQRGVRGSGKGIGQGVENNYRRGALGHRGDREE